MRPLFRPLVLLVAFFFSVLLCLYSVRDNILLRTFSLLSLLHLSVTSSSGANFADRSTSPLHPSLGVPSPVVLYSANCSDKGWQASMGRGVCRGYVKREKEARATRERGRAREGAAAAARSDFPELSSTFHDNAQVQRQQGLAMCTRLRSGLRAMLKHNVSKIRHALCLCTSSSNTWALYP